MPSTRWPLPALAVLFLALASLACNTLLGGPASPTPAPATAQAGPSPTVPAAATETPGAQPATATAPAPTETPAAPTPPPAGGGLVLIQTLDNQAVLLGADGQPQPLSALSRPVYVYADLDPAIEQGPRAYAIGPQGAQPLPFVENIHAGFASWTSPDGSETRLAWDEYSLAADNSLLSRIWTSGPAGEDRRVLWETAESNAVLQVLAWTPDGQLLYSLEPLGLGGYIPFAGFSNLSALSVQDGQTVTTAWMAPQPDRLICLTDVRVETQQVAFHCERGFSGVFSVTAGTATVVSPPPELEGQFQLLGDTRFSPDGSRLAFALARGNPEAEQGWVAVTEGLASPARLALTAPEGVLFNIAGWLDDHTLVLQTAGVTPGVWLANVDTGQARQVAEAFVLEIIR